MPGIDASIPLGAKAPDQMQSLSGMLNFANGAQTLQQNQQKTQQGSMDLQQRQSVQGILSNLNTYTDGDGNVDLARLQSDLIKNGGDTGVKAAQEVAIAHQQGTQAKRFLGQLTDENRNRIGQAMYSAIDASPDVMGQTLDAIGQQYKGIGGQDVANTVKSKYLQTLQAQGPDAARNYALQTARSVMSQNDQQNAKTPTVVPVTNNQQSWGANVKPDIPNMPVGSVVPGTTAQMQLPPTTPTVAPGTNQPGYLGPQPPAQPQPGQPQGAGPQPQPGVNGAFTGNPDVLAQAIGAIKDPQERANAQAAFEAQMRATNGQLPPRGFVPSGPVPGANEAKGGTVQTMNQHWDNLNKQSENSQLLEGLLGNIKSLAPGAITGTEAGRKAYVNGLLNALHLGNQATGDMQRDTDLLEKNIAQLGLNTPATTDAMRTIIGAARPHSTMSKEAIEEASAQLTGQIQANRAVRNALAAPKRIADQTGDPSAYQSVRQHMEDVADPRAWQFQALSPEGRKQMLSKLAPEDRASLRSKISELHDMGLLK